MSISGVKSRGFESLSKLNKAKQTRDYAIAGLIALVEITVLTVLNATGHLPQIHISENTKAVLQGLVNVAAWGVLIITGTLAFFCILYLLSRLLCR